MERMQIMIIYKCKMCGGNLNIQEGEKTAVCEYCQTQQTVPSTNDEKRVERQELIWK